MNLPILAFLFTWDFDFRSNEKGDEYSDYMNMSDCTSSINAEACTSSESSPSLTKAVACAPHASSVANPSMSTTKLSG